MMSSSKVPMKGLPILSLTIFINPLSFGAHVLSKHVTNAKTL